MPVLNGARFIEAALDSVISQPVPIAEIIVVDDGSTDNCADLAASHVSKPIVVKQSHRGPAAARNHGIKLAKSPFVAFMDHDDLWSEDKLVLQCQAFEDNPELMVCFGRVNYFWEDPDCEEALAFKDHARTNAVAGYITTTMLARKSVFDTVGYLDETLTFADSIQWTSELQDRGVPTHMLDEVVLHHRMHDTNLTRRRKESTAEIMQVLRKRRMAGKTSGV